MLVVSRAGSGAAARARLEALVAEAQRDDPLHPVTVVVPATRLGLQLRRALAARGFAAVRFSVLASLAEALAASRLADDGWMPLTRELQDAVLRSALASSDARLQACPALPALLPFLRTLDAEIRGDAAAVARIRSDGGWVANAALDVLTVARHTARHRRLYDGHDLLEAAAAAVAARPAHVAAEIGTICVMLPAAVDPASASLIRSLATVVDVHVVLPSSADPPGFELLGAASPPHRTTATPPARAVIAADAHTEVRAAVRACLAALDADPPTPLHRQALLYVDTDVYAPLVRSTLQQLGITYNSLEGAVLADTAPARSLLGLLRLRDAGFARSAVLAWLATFPDGSGVHNQSRWDQLSRNAGVVRGVDQWRDRLQLLIEQRRADLDTLSSEDPAHAARRAALNRDIEDATRIRAHVEELDRLTTPPREQSWPAHVAWLLHLCDTAAAPKHGWPSEAVAAWELLRTAIEALGAAAEIEPQVSLDVVVAALDASLRARRVVEGRLADGLLIGSHRRAAGIDVDRLHVLGATEGRLPAPPPVDPLLPGDELGRSFRHELQERRMWDMVCAGARHELVVSAPSVDADGRAVYPSPWLLRLVSDQGSVPSAAGVRDGTTVNPRVTREPAFAVPPPDATALCVEELREWEALRPAAAGQDVAATALALREDLPLRRALTVLRSRASGELTEFDGNLGGVAGDSPTLSAGLAARLHSATAIESWAECGFRFFLDRVLSVAETAHVDDDQWWRISAVQKGSLMHEVLEDFFGEVSATGSRAPEDAWGDEDLALLDRIIARHFERAERRGVTGHPVVWAADAQSIRSDLHELLVVDSAQRADGGWTPRFFEQPFGMSDDPRCWPELTFPLGGGRTVTMRGLIDRVDVREHGARVVDYKTGRRFAADISSDNLFEAGSRLQLAVYATAVRRWWQSTQDGAVDVDAMYWFITRRARFSQVDLRAPGRSEAALLTVLDAVDAGLRAGSFPQVPGEFDNHLLRFDHCRHCAYDDLCPSARDLAALRKRDSPGAAPHRRLSDAAVGGGEP